MAVRQIRVLGDPVLRTPADPVRAFDERLHGLIEDLLDTMDTDDGRVGLAAPQIGVGLRAFAYDIDGSRGHLINPTLELTGETQEGDEGCLSVPQLWFSTERAYEATATGVDMYGQPVTVKGTEQLARCLQHETDHLDGVVFIDRLEREQRKQAMREIRTANW